METYIALGSNVGGRKDSEPWRACGTRFANRRTMLHRSDWHGDLLAERAAAIERGEATFDDWKTVKRRIGKQVL